MSGMEFTALRERRGLSKAQLAHSVGLDPKTIWFIEAGKVRSPRYDNVIAIAKIFDVTPNYLAGVIRRDFERRVALEGQAA